MDLNHQFEVPVPVEEAWKILTVKVKVGPIQAQFKGQASFVERDDSAHKAVLKGEGRDTGGKGNASAVITAQLSALSPTNTECKVHTDLSITGKVAQFGRGAMADISEKILAQFVVNLNELIATQPSSSTAPAEVAAPTTAPRGKADRLARRCWCANSEACTAGRGRRRSCRHLADCSIGDDVASGLGHRADA
jgi:carbon monoxide dehydrogenase subunit G